jgi:hypothetical protein
MEYWSVGVLRQVLIVPLGRGVGGAEKGVTFITSTLIFGNLSSPSLNIILPDGALRRGRLLTHLFFETALKPDQPSL